VATCASLGTYFYVIPILNRESTAEALKRCPVNLTPEGFEGLEVFVITTLAETGETLIRQLALWVEKLRFI